MSPWHIILRKYICQEKPKTTELRRIKIEKQEVKVEEEKNIIHHKDHL